eukprot:scaffold2917_cov191-Amphora_coffeaeformis.AAC.46
MKPQRHGQHDVNDLVTRYCTRVFICEKLLDYHVSTHEQSNIRKSYPKEILVHTSITSIPNYAAEKEKHRIRLIFTNAVDSIMVKVNTTSSTLGRRSNKVVVPYQYHTMTE